MAFLRAKSDKQKQERIQEIMDAAAELYDEVGYDKVTFSKIGGKVNYTRITLYNYFSCKEDIFLKIIEQDTESLMLDVARTFTAPCPGAVAFADAWTELMMRNQRFLSLMSIVNTIIIRDASEERHEHYRRHLNKCFLKMAVDVGVALPAMRKEEIMDFLDIENSYAMTMYSASLEYKLNQKIKVFPDAGYGTISFRVQFKKMLIKILKGFGVE